MDKSMIFDHLSALNIPNPSGVIITSGTAMAVLGLRTTDDIDLVVDTVTWQYLCSLPDWITKQNSRGGTYLTDGQRFDVWKDWEDTNTGNRVQFDEISTHCHAIEGGYLLPSIQYQIVMKQMLHRSKDDADIKLLRQSY